MANLRDSIGKLKQKLYLAKKVKQDDKPTKKVTRKKRK